MASEWGKRRGKPAIRKAHGLHISVAGQDFEVHPHGRGTRIYRVVGKTFRRETSPMWLDMVDREVERVSAR